MLGSVLPVPPHATRQLLGEVGLGGLWKWCSFDLKVPIAMSALPDFGFVPMLWIELSVVGDQGRVNLRVW